MAFMMKKKKYRFTVDLCLEEITAVPFINGVLFAKVRLLDGGNFMETSSREEVEDHRVRWGAQFKFVCKMTSNASTGVLDPCLLRVSVRKELKGGRSFQKLGFTDLNLAEFAGSGQTQRKCLLEGYDTRRRQDNSMLSISIRMNMLSGDILFKVPSPTAKQKVTVGVEETGGAGVGVSSEEQQATERREDFSGGSVASASSGFSSLTKKRPPLFSPDLMSGEGEETPVTPGDTGGGGGRLEGSTALDEGLEMGHSRNSSNTSQLSKGSGYGSLSSHHSRQSSSTSAGDSSHVRSPSWPVWYPGVDRGSPPPSKLWETPQTADGGKGKPVFRFPPWSGPSAKAASSPGLLSPPQPSPHQPSRSQPPPSPRTPLSSRNNAGAGGVGGGGGGVTAGTGGPLETGSLDRGKAALERRKKAADEGPSAGRVEFTRVNPNSLIDHIIRSTNIGGDDTSSHSTGLQLFIAKDGTAALGGQEVKSHMPTGVFKQVVIEENSNPVKSPVEKPQGLKNGHCSSLF